MHNNNDAPEIDAIEDPRKVQLEKIYEELLQKPEAEPIRQDPPELLIMTSGPFGMMHNAGASQSHNEIIMGGMLLSVLNPDEQKAILAHEMAHKIMQRIGQAEEGFFSHMNEKNERRADNIHAALMDYNVEPMISGIAKMRAHVKKIYKMIAETKDEDLVSWPETSEKMVTEPGKEQHQSNAKIVDAGIIEWHEEETPAVPLFTRVTEAISNFSNALGVAWYMTTDRSHPHDGARARYLRNLAKKHAAETNQQR